MFELAEIYNEMMDLKLTVANCQSDSETLDSHTIKKLNHLCGASAKYVCEVPTFSHQSIA